MGGPSITFSKLEMVPNIVVYSDRHVTSLQSLVVLILNRLGAGWKMKHGEMVMSVENIGGISCYLPAYYLHIERVAAGQMEPVTRGEWGRCGYVEVISN